MKKCRWLFGLIAFVCFILVWGILGSLDAGKLQLGAGLIYIVIIGTAGTVSGLIGFRRD